MAYEMRYDGDAGVFMVVVREKGELSHVEVGDIIVYFGKDGKPLLWGF